MACADELTNDGGADKTIASGDEYFQIGLTLRDSLAVVRFTKSTYLE